MSRRSKLTVAVVVGVVALLGAGWVAFSQAPAPRQQGGPQGGGMGMAGMRQPEVVRGKVLVKDEKRQAIKVEREAKEAAGAGEEREKAAEAVWVAFRPDTVTKRVIEVAVDELQVGDVIMVEGVPTAIDARRIVTGEVLPMGPEPLQQGIPGNPKNGGPAVEGGQAGPMAGGPQPGMMVGRRAMAHATARGKVVDLSPLTIECQVPVPPAVPSAGGQPEVPVEQTVRVKIATDENTRVLKIVNSSFEDIKVGEEVAAAGPRWQGEVLKAGLVYVGADLEGIIPGLGGRGGFGGGGVAGPSGMKAPAGAGAGAYGGGGGVGNY